jgi:hypothetical protein
MTLLIRLLSIILFVSLLCIGAGFAVGDWQGESVAAASMPVLFVSTVLVGAMQLLQVRKMGLR